MFRRAAALVALTLAASLTAAIPASADSAARMAVASAAELTISPDRTAFITNRDWAGSWGLYRAEISGGWESYDLQWTLHDAEGDLVAGPQTVVSDGRNPVRDFRFFPLGEEGPVLAAGSYLARFTVILKSGGGTENVIDEVPVSLVDDPPADNPRVYGAERINRYVDGTHIKYATFRVQAYEHTYGDGRIRLRDRNGKLIASQPVENPCWIPLALDQPCTDRVFDIKVPAYSLNRLPLKPGTYTAAFTMPDSWGRAMTKQLGSVYVQAKRRLARTVTLAPAAAESIGQLVGRCSTVRKPGPHKWAGSIGLLSLNRCGDRRGTADLAQKSFTVKVPRVVGYATFEGFDFRTLGWVSASDVQLGCQVAWDASSRWNQSIRLARGYGWSSTCHYDGYTGRDVQGRRVYLRLRAVNGQRFDVRKLRVQFDYEVWRTVS